jgi:hypothetical protein
VTASENVIELAVVTWNRLESTHAGRSKLVSNLTRSFACRSDTTDQPTGPTTISGVRATTRETHEITFSDENVSHIVANTIWSQSQAELAISSTRRVLAGLRRDRSLSRLVVPTLPGAEPSSQGLAQCGYPTWFAADDLDLPLWLSMSTSNEGLTIVVNMGKVP